jgi:hypothetical protein
MCRCVQHTTQGSSGGHKFFVGSVAGDGSIDGAGRYMFVSDGLCAMEKELKGTYSTIPEPQWLPTLQ